MNTLTPDQKKFLSSLSTPNKIQDYLESIPFNHEESGETCLSPKQVLIQKKAHCMEGALFACACLLLQKRKPLVVSLRVLSSDYDHVVTLYKENGYWGAISKTNHSVLGFRDPVYKTVRELVLSYFHEYFLIHNGEKTLRGYSSPVNINRFGKSWITTDEHLFTIAEYMYDRPHKSIIPKGNEKFLRNASTFERASADISRDGI